MARKKRKKKKSISGGSWYSNLNEETKHSIFAVASFVLAVFFTLASFGKAGVVGDSLYKILELLFGAGFFLLPAVFFLASFFLLFSIKPNFLSNTIIGGLIFLLSGLGLVDILFQEKFGGYIGYFMSWPLLKFFEFWLSFIILSAVFIISFLIMLNTTISFKKVTEKIKERRERKAEEKAAKAEEEEEDEEEEEEEEYEEQEEEEDEEEEDEEYEEEDEDEEPSKKSSKEILVENNKKIKQVEFTPPPIELFANDKGKPSSGDIKANANIIKRTLRNFGIEVEMDEINIGPSVTQYTLKPAEGIKLSRILGLQNDLALALAAHPLRMEAPIPGKSLVGIEIPNSSKTLVGMAGLFGEEAFKSSTAPLLIALGRDVTGTPTYADLTKMPHMLIAGATGAGKSICIHTLITSLLFRNSPEALRFMMIDPKRVELTIYNKIPHLLLPVITKPKKAVQALRWACKEMDRRYEELLKAGVRNVASYHKKHKGYNSMPYLVIIVDELADMMSTFPREMEAAIVRLAQMSRAVGIHLVVSTQRPSVEIITGLIKANIPSRVALQVTSQVDSRTILDTSGAEKLLGSGDMLFIAGNTSKPKRIQGPFISEKEIKRVVDYLDEEYKDIDLEEQDIMEEDENGNKAQSSFSMNISDEHLEQMEKDDDEDEFYEEAREMVIQTQKASTSFLQRKFKIGYARAARLMDTLEEKGIVSAGDGAKAREVLIQNPDEQTLEEQADDLLEEAEE
jgi:S-DNA-T family DNA segregation ATPase FtsK/SpoIIIE